MHFYVTMFYWLTKIHAIASVQDNSKHRLTRRVVGHRELVMCNCNEELLSPSAVLEIYAFS